MIDSTYAVNCLKQGFQRYIRCNKINATIDCGDNYVSFYAKDNNSNKQYLARGSNHHLRMQNLADKDEPWKGDNISIVFITLNSQQDIRIRPRVQQKPYGGIKPFDVTTYQYDNTILDEMDLSQIFRSIQSFLEGNGYIDPFKGTPKAAKVIPISANIKPYKEPTRKSRNICVDKDGNNVSANSDGADYVSENKQYKTNTNMNKKYTKLTESDLHRIVKKSVNRILRESVDGICYTLDDPDEMLEQIWNIYCLSQGKKGISENELYKVDNFLMLQDVAYHSKEGSFLVNQYIDAVGGIESMVKQEMEHLKDKHITPYIGMLQRAYNDYVEPKGWYQGEPYWGGYPGRD